jgi:PST family polysaccharide transporter
VEGEAQDPATPDGAAPPLRSVAVRGTSLALVGWLSSQGLLFVAYVVLARLVSPAQFGRYAAASVIVGVGGLFAESGMMAALINRRDRLEEAASTAAFSLIVSGFLLSVAAAAVAPLVGLYFRSSEVGWLSAALAGWLLVRAMTVVPDALLQRRFSFARRVAVDPLGAIAFSATAIALCAGGAGPWGIVVGQYASMAVQVISSWAFARFVPRWRLASIAMWRELAAFARPVLGAEMMRRVAGVLDAIMLGRFASAATLGQYRQGLRFAQQPSNAFIDVGAYVLLPTFARLTDHRDRLSAATKRVFSAVGALALPVSVATVPLGVPVAVLALGARWRGAGHAIAGLSFMLLGMAMVSVASEAVKAVGKPQLLVRIHTVTLAVTAVTVVATAVPFGLLGVAIAVSASQCTAGLFSYFLLTSELDISWSDLVPAFAGPAVASGAMLASMLAFSAAVDPLSHGEVGGIALELAEIAIAIAIYLVVLLTVDSGHRRDFRSLLRRVQTFAASRS